MSKRGLPETLRMRHDEHYVEALAASAGAPVGRMVPIELLDPNPNQPRQVMGDLSELMASVAEKGIIEPLIVRQRGDRYQIIAGERRYHAAVQVGLAGGAGRRPRGRRRRGHGAGAGREPAAQGPDGVRRSGGAAAARAEVPLHARGHGAEAGQVAHVDHRIAVAEQHAGRGAEPLSAGRHYLQVDAAADRPAGGSRRRCWRWSRSWRRRARSRARRSARRPPSRRPGSRGSSCSAFNPPTKTFQLRMSFKKGRVEKAEIIEALENIIKRTAERPGTVAGRGCAGPRGRCPSLSSTSRKHRLSDDS